MQQDRSVCAFELSAPLNETLRFINPPWQRKWMLANQTARPSPTWTNAWAKTSKYMQTHAIQILLHDIFQNCLALFFPSCTHMFMHCFHFFSFFLLIQKSITPWIIIQLTWDFLHNDLHDVFYFLMIFPEFVLGWIFNLPRVCSCICYLVPCFPFWLWNDDGWSNECENWHA